MEDCPFEEAEGSEALTEETVEGIEDAVFEAYVGRLYRYLQVVETRLFSEGLHVLGRPPSPSQMVRHIIDRMVYSLAQY
jgi:magnesium chelatase subunit H